jgi:putative YhbY family RNA-binding protein
MPAIHLTPAQRKEKRGDAHHLDPVVLIGDQGLTDAVTREVDLALKSHGLIKVRMFSDSRPDREAALAKLAETPNAAPVQHIGKLLVLWRPIPEKAKVETRDERGAGPRVVKILKFSKSGSQRAQIKKITVFGNQRVTAGGEIKRVQKRVTSVKKRAAD